ncbi:MAG: acyl-CoA thioesterase [Proteobacteria bacterium]|nr:acyl-CoA thioesterase [Pseudomonadota bacterium]
MNAVESIKPIEPIEPIKPLSKTIVHRVDVQFGDCDPAGIVFFPNYSRWMDAASHHFFMACGLQPWRAMSDLPHCVGAPLLEIQTRFHTAVTYGEQIELHTCIEAWRGKVFIQHHRVMRGDQLVCEGRETRALCVREADGRLKAMPVPEFVRAACA